MFRKYVAIIKSYQYVAKTQTAGCSSILSKRKKYSNLIKKFTEVTTNHMTPEIKLHLITQNCELWHSRGDNSPFLDPFWAFYWPGGQVITRYVLDTPDEFKGRRVLDIGCGCGASSIAAKLVGASHVLANDTDKVAITAVSMNAEINNVLLQASDRNFIGETCNNWDVVLLGDMFYDVDFADVLSEWVAHFLSQGTKIFIGDPGRLPLVNHPMMKQLTKTAEYDLPDHCKMENSGLHTGCVWKVTQ